MRDETFRVLMWTGCFVAIWLITYGFALWGEPRSVLVMRDVLGIL